MVCLEVLAVAVAMVKVLEVPQLADKVTLGEQEQRETVALAAVEQMQQVLQTQQLTLAVLAAQVQLHLLLALQ
jgi:hypothetical protein